MITYNMWNNLLINKYLNKLQIWWLQCVIFTIPTILLDILFLPFELISILLYKIHIHNDEQMEIRKRIKKRLKEDGIY